MKHNETDKIKNPKVAEIFSRYPDHIRDRLAYLRQLVFDAAAETEGLGQLEETTRWGEPSYIVKGGSTIRIDWKSSTPTQYAMYFHCTTKLIDTFKELYGSKFRFEGNRAIVFHETDEVPAEELKHCVSLCLTYHRRKHLPMLGV
jgi:hypothetical protein